MPRTIPHCRPRRWLLAAAAAATLLVSAAPAADFKQKGFVEVGARLFPQRTANDRAHGVADALLRWEPSLRVPGGVTFFATLDARTDSHRQVERDLDFSWFDRTPRRPLLSVRRLSMLYRHKILAVEVGKQLVRWGKTDILNPTDRFAPKDYLATVDTDYLSVTAARVTLEKASNTLDLVYVPRFTPARLPLLDQRWAPSAGVPAVTLRDAGARFPGGPQFGVRFNRIETQLEWSVSYYEGYHNLPLLTPVRFDAVARRVDLLRTYPRLRAFGGDLALPLRWFTLKGETEMFTSSTAGADDYLLYVVQLERQWKEWVFIGGYAGQVETERGGGSQYRADRGLTRALVGRASVNLTPSRSLTLESVARQNGEGFYGKAEYSQAVGQHWRVSATFAGIRGDMSDFLGQYRRNSFAALVLRYSF